MCGIAAIFSYRDGQPVSESELLAIRDRMTSRGPDGAGIWISGDRSVGLAHRRLSILDLSPSGAQPMFDVTGSFGISFNGEIYNYRELRAELEKRGFHFRSTTDTEVLLHLYADRGVRMLDCLRGMFAFALWDERKKALLLARDPYGIKPLYYSDNGKVFRAASQVKALLAGGNVDTTANPAGHVGFFLWGHVPDPHTLYRGIRALPAGSFIWVPSGKSPSESVFCSIPQIFSDPLPMGEGAEREPARSASAIARSLRNWPKPLEKPRASCKETVRQALHDTVRRHLIADVPVGVFLSSGVDSAVIAALAAEEGGSLQTVTLAFDEYKGTPNDEAPLAEDVARLYGSDHRTVRVTRRDFENRFDHLLWSMDQPTTDGINSYWVSYAAQQCGLKVALSGLGGDELFGGYPSFRQVPKLVQAIGLFGGLKSLGLGFRMVSAPLLKRWTSPKYAGLLEYGGTYSGAYLLRRGLFMPWELPEVLGADLARQGWNELHALSSIEADIAQILSPRSRLACLESCWYMRNQLLRDSDWAGMAHSIEIRVPLVDIELLRSTGKWIANGQPPNKRMMLQAPLWPLPDAVFSRPKTGFTVPIRQWLVNSPPRRGGEARQLSRGWRDGVARSASPIGRSLNSSSANEPNDRGLRSWSKLVYSHFASSTAA